MSPAYRQRPPILLWVSKELAQISSRDSKGFRVSGFAKTCLAC